jgi:alkanesulfonate monooxygenase SsuD/methylene tetrahydromethanopterin reductase-like flavin-dependent oxidoreductase (luciferase family)
VTNGRAGFNIVTSFGKSPAKCMGMEEAVPHDKRYEAAEEYMDLLYRLVISDFLPSITLVIKLMRITISN